MKVLFLTNIPSPYRVDFFNELGNMCDLTVLYESKSLSSRNENWVSKKAINFNEIYLSGKNIRKDMPICLSVVRYLKKDLFDMFVIGGYSTPTGLLAIEYCKLMGIPFMLSADGGIIKPENRLKYQIKKHFISSASSCLSAGNHTSNYLMHYGAKKEKINEYPFTSLLKKDIIKSVLSQEERSLIKDKLGLKNNLTAITVGQFIHRKGFDVLINAWTNVSSDFNLLIIGGGEKSLEFKEQITRLNLKNVTLLDFMNSDELSEYYKASELFILPTREDVWGLVVNEAMAHGLPVITTNKCVAGLELVTDNENGFIVQVDNEKELAQRINEVLSNKDIRESMGIKSLDRIAKYTIENMAKEHLSIFEKTI